MAVYGGYETFDEVHRGALTSVWKARAAASSSDGIFVVKVCHSSEWADEGAGGVALLAGMGETVADLRALAAAGSTGWAPVLAAGQDEREGFWVTRFFPRSLERVIEGRAHLPLEDIHWLAAAVAHALAELQERLDRPHGNLKPANIFIDGEGRISGAPVILSDLKPRRELDREADAMADFHALGRMLVHLLRRQRANLQATIGWPLEPGPDWNRLGRVGESWRELCNLLLNPHAAPAEHEWTFVEQRLRQIAARDSKPMLRSAIVGTAAVVALGAITGLGYLRFRTPEKIPDSLQGLAALIGNPLRDTTVVPPEWAVLFRDYHEWLGGFLLVIRDTNQTADWRRRPYLNERVLSVLLAAESNPGLNPRNFSDPPMRGTPEDLVRQPPEVVKKGAVVQKILRASTAVGKAKQAFLEWPDRQKLVDLAARFTALGWKGPAAELQHIIDAGASGAISSENINAILASNQTAALTESQWIELERRGQVLAGGGDPVMRGITRFLSARVAAAADIGALNRALAATTGDTNRWLDLVQGNAGKPRFDRVRFARESGLKDFSGDVTDDVIQRWEREAQDFVFVAARDDPRPTAEHWNKLTGAIDEMVKSIRDEERVADGGPRVAGILQTELDTLKMGVTNLLGRALVQRDLPGVTAEVVTLTAKLDALRTRASDALTELSPKSADWIALVGRTEIGAAGSVLRREWMRRRDELLRTAPAATELDRRKAEFRELRARFATLKRFFTELGGERGVGTLARFDGRSLAPDLAATLQGWAATRTEGAIDGWLKLVEWNNGVPTRTAEEFLAGARASDIAQQLARAFGDAAGLGREAMEFATRVNQGYGLDDPATAAFARWRQHLLMAEWNALRPVRAVFDVLDALERLRAETRSDVLVAGADAPELGVAFAAWLRLGTVANWPAPENLETELRLATALTRRIERDVTDAAHRAEMLERLQRERRERWRQAFRRARGEAAIGEVLARREAFQVRDEDLAPEERFNAEVFRFKRANLGGLSSDELAAERDRTVPRLRELAGARATPEITAALQALADLPLGDAKGEPVDVRKLGPGAKGWTGATSVDGRQIEFVWKGRAQEHRLRFQLVEGDAIVPYFLATTEIPVGLVLDLAVDPAVKAPLIRWLRVVIGDSAAIPDQRVGPYAWYLQGDSLRLSGSWLNRQTSWQRLGEDPFYPESLPPPAGPSRKTPFQYVPPEAAQYLAHDVLGCRLPTREEWKGLVVPGRPPAMSSPVEPNVRDLLWQQERDYLVGRGVIENSAFHEGIFRLADSREKTVRDTTAVAPKRNDGFLWFAPVGDDSASFHHLLGNVAEYLYDDGRFFVAGGSALSSPEIDPTIPYEVESRQAQEGFSDVGLRLAFDAPGSVTARSRLQQLVRNLPFL